MSNVWNKNGQKEAKIRRTSGLQVTPAKNDNVLLTVKVALT